MNHEPFSRRHGFCQANDEIKIRNEAPLEVREALLMIANGELDLGAHKIRDVLCAALRKTPDSNNWSEPNVWGECQHLLENAKWYKVYDFVEYMHRELSRPGQKVLATKWELLVNGYFSEAGVGWKLENGELVSRGHEAFEQSVGSAVAACETADFPTARQEIHEALLDLSRRPEPDLTGAIHHAMGALECVAREIANDPKLTLGEVLKRHPCLVPKPLDESLSKMWGYASEVARHIREGRCPSHAEAELVVGVAAAACCYLATQVAAIKAT